MHDDMRVLLNAYLDGELKGTRLQDLKHHLAECEPCRNELNELRQVSALLQAAPTPEFMPAGRFASNLMLTLPRRSMHDLPSKPASLAWWFVPAGLLGSWYFIQTVFTLTNAVSAAQMAGLLGQAARWLSGGQQTVWFAAMTSLLGSRAGTAQPTLSLLNTLSVTGANLLNGFLWQALIALLYWSWLSVWWFKRRPRSMEIVTT
ncbi:MAG TPA: zf-HC2 domain-containing protein [Anaerolineales bacterium]|nr:zf-HC2 domain-containing protein [Anaerolineales bacterium]